MNNFTGRLTRLLGILALAGLVGASATAETFVSFNGKFHFSYPDSWAQVDYQTAEFYLTRGEAETEVDFEAVFSERQTFVIFQGQYLILTVDTVGNMTPEKIDSVLAELTGIQARSTAPAVWSPLKPKWPAAMPDPESACW